MTIEIYALSVLRRGPVHGYELKRRVQRPSIAAVNNNSLYPALRRLEQSGAVTKTVELQEGRPARNVYALTPRGRELLTELVSTLPPDLASDDEEFLLRVSFFDELAVPARRAVLRARQDVVEAALAQVRSLLADADPARSWRRRAQEQLVERLEQELLWIEALRGEAEQP
ncbi:PadR family transcriptional regulator [Cellulomonas sp.]|uniref:PadR family transcriptional regulator n=1 Tax=Cellulomonas sp. TaxID=40001 RepID=UPI003BA9D1C5